MARPVVTGDTDAIRSAFGTDLALTPCGDAVALSARIRALLDDEAELERLAARGRDRFVREYSHEALGRLLGRYVDELTGSRATASSDGPRPGASA
jgi:glycosyltransferase involved in cell wall biosynthesis